VANPAHGLYSMDGDSGANFGHTTNTACRVCGGGVWSFGVKTTPSVTTPPITPPPVTGESCADVIGTGIPSSGWYDSSGPECNCDWYMLHDHDVCNMVGDECENFGHTANTACCACGGTYGVKLDLP
jgi:hypothetical protein